MLLIRVKYVGGLLAEHPSIHPNQRPLQLLGKRLSELLDEDQFAECEGMLFEAGVVPPY